MRNTQPEQMFSGLPPEADIDRGGRHVSNVPTTRHQHLIDHLVSARGKEREIYWFARSAAAAAVAMYFE
jgi:hypothetical protein